jgi:peptide/nickel transport system substrate-binding protein
MRLIAAIANGLNFLFFLFLIGNSRANEFPRRGGTLIISLHSEPKTLNPLVVSDTSSRGIVGLISADLIHINNFSQQTEPALASSWEVTEGGRRYMLHLRQGVRFSDGAPFDADDVLFSFRSYLDERVQSPQRDLLIISGKPILVQKIDAYTVVFTLARPYAAAERLFDGIAMLPRHLLEARLTQGTLQNAWTTGTPPAEIAGLGPFRLKEYVPGQHLVLERNPYYWKRDQGGQQLPYLDRIASIFTANADAEVMRFKQGETDVVSNLGAANFALLARQEQQSRFQLKDLGPGLEYDFLFFNQNELPSEPEPGFFKKQSWFKDTRFRQAVSSAIDRQAIVQVAYFGRADALATQVTPGNKLWVNSAITPPVRSLERARALLRSGGFSWTDDKLLIDRSGLPVRFSITVNAAKPQQVKMATLIQQDLSDLGITADVNVVEIHTLLDRIFKSYKYEAAIIGLADGDTDPNSEMNVLTSTGTAHLWKLQAGASPPPPWQREIDELMERQLITPTYSQRKQIYDRVQQLIWENMPVICLVSPHILVAAKSRVGNFHPAILGNYTLWNADWIFLRP